MIITYCRTIRSEIIELFNSTWNKEEVLEDWKVSIVVPVSKNGDIKECRNYRGISLSPITYKYLSKMLLSGLNPNAWKFEGDH